MDTTPRQRVELKLEQFKEKQKSNEHMIKVIEAYLDGKTIQTRTGYGWSDFKVVAFDADEVDYRIKPDPVWRAVLNFEEAKQFLDKYVRFKYNPDNQKYIINAIGNWGMKTTCYFETKSFDFMFQTFECVDGSPLGILEEPN